ncbi:MAG: DUF2157 domain-containing protein [Kiritimatiellia bacterium]
MENGKVEAKEKLGQIMAQWLKRHLELWVDAGILSRGQQEAITNLYAWPEQDAARPAGDRPALKLVVILEAIGAFLIGIGVISLVAFNWPGLPNFFKLAIIIASIASAHLAGFLFLARRPKFEKAGLSLVFLGNLFYGAGIWLVAQMYHVNYGFTAAFFLWAIGIVPFAWLLKSELNFFLALALFIGWTFGEAFGDMEPHLPFLIILLGLLGPLSYYLKSKVGLAVCLATGGAWLLVNNILWFGENISIHLVAPLALYGIALLAISNLHAGGRLAAYRQVYLVIGLVAAGIAIGVIPLCGPIKFDPRAMTLATLPASFWTCSGLLLAGVLAAWALARTTDLDQTGIEINKMLPFLLAAALFVFLMPFFKGYMTLSLLPVILIAIAHRHFSKSTALLNILLVYLFFWLPFCLIRWEQPLMLFLLYPAYGAACYLLGWNYVSKLHNAGLGNAFKFFGLFAVFAALYTFSSSEISRSFVKDYSFPSSFDFWLLMAVFYAGAIFAYVRLAGFAYPAHKNGLLPEERFMVPVLLVIPAALIAVYSCNLAGTRQVFAANFCAICMLMAFLVAGYRRREAYLKALALVFLVLLVGSRFLEIEWSLLYKAVLFILTGVIVLVGGIIFEKYKDKVAIIEQ